MTDTPGQGYGQTGNGEPRDPQVPSASEPGAQSYGSGNGPQYGAQSYGAPSYGAQSYGDAASGQSYGDVGSGQIYGAPATPQSGVSAGGYQAPEAPNYGSAPDPAAGGYQPPAPGAQFGAAAGQYGSVDPYAQPSGGYGDPNALAGQAQPAAGYGDPYAQQQPYGSTGAIAQAQSGLVEVPGLGVVKVATIGQRFLARLLDGVIIGIPMTIVYVVLFASAMGVAQGGSSSAGAESLFVTSMLMMLFLAVFTVAYEVVMIAIKGQTVGKMALGIKVVQSANGQAAGWGPSFIRWVIPMVANAVCGIGWLVYLSVLFDNTGRAQGWHDKAANDLVISLK